MNVRVLLVDDDAMVLRTMEMVLSTRKWQVITADSGKDAISLIEKERFDAVITDMRMETSTAGFDVVRAARAQSNHTVAVILSAYPIAPADWKRAGADAMFSKGSGVQRMLDDIDKLVNARRSSSEGVSGASR